MNIYDFTTGWRGKVLDAQAHNTTGGNTLARADGVKVKVAITTESRKHTTHYTFAEFVGKEYYDGELGRQTPFWVSQDTLWDKYGVEAIAFCTGQDPTTGNFEWRFIATRNWLNRNRNKLTITQP